MIEFRCENCRQVIRVQDVLCGHKYRCPNCSQFQLVPAKTFSIAEPNGKNAQNDSFLNPSVFDLTDRKHRKAVEKESTERICGLPGIGGAVDETNETPPERKFPAIFDIFLYPISVTGLMMIGIFICVPLLTELSAKLLIVLLPDLLGLFFSIIIKVVGLVIFLVLPLYMYWYICRCVRDSAEGNIRAPSILIDSPTIYDMFFQTLKVLSCFSLFLAPAIVYFKNSGKIDYIFFLLCGYAAVFFPMGLLAVIMFDSIIGLNPFLIVKSILKALLQYAGIFLAFLLLIGLFVFSFIASFRPSLIPYLSYGVLLYFLMIFAHLLGRFYWRNSDKLQWDV